MRPARRYETPNGLWRQLMGGEGDDHLDDPVGLSTGNCNDLISGSGFAAFTIGYPNGD